jgi:ribosome recycling factor
MKSAFVNEKEPEFAKAIDFLKAELATLRTGRAQSSLVEQIQADYYGVKTPLIQIAQIAVPEPRMITIQPYDRSALKEIEKAIQASSLGINPVNDGAVIRLVIPSMTEERRKELVKIVAQYAEKARVAVRQIREDAVKAIQKMEKDGNISEDDKISAKEDLQKIVDKYNEEIKTLSSAKEKEVMTI